MTNVDGGDFSGTDAEVTPEGVALLRAYVNAHEADDAALERAWDSAAALVAAYVGLSVVPPVVLQQATLLVAAELFQRRNAPNGIAQFATPDGYSGIRVARDPMLSAYPLLRPFTGLGFA